MVGLDVTQLEDVCGGGVAGKVLKVGGPILDAGTSLWDGYQSYSQARADHKSVAPSLGEGAVGTVRSFTLYDLWAPIIMPTPAY
ncbi:MAG TPA: hypothetical protein VGG74_37275 [Kofleriaceae bacterium]|jgi:hypothetical protein